MDDQFFGSEIVAIYTFYLKRIPEYCTIANSLGQGGVEILNK